ncbi:MAG: hypothetical protein A2X94_12675 [Bdellovibrionales bacterium GWB1_55_8]|nr:MAG: hypothetical protein A2X94_12675 [Bdellovibrionales bacterium GWB1_55_8]
MKLFNAIPVVAVLIAGLIGTQTAFCDGGGGYESNGNEGNGTAEALLLDWETLADLENNLEQDDGDITEHVIGGGIEGH